MPETIQTHNATPQPRQRLHLLPRGIGARVNLAFAIICAVMVGTLILSWLAFEELGEQISEFNDIRTPSLSKSIHLLSIANSFHGKGPSLAGASSDNERQKIYERLFDDLNRMALLNVASTSEQIETENYERIGRLVERLKTSLTLLNSSAKYRINLLEAQREILKGLEALFNQPGLYETAEANGRKTVDIKLVKFDRTLARLQGHMTNWLRVRTQTELDEQIPLLKVLTSSLSSRSQDLSPEIRQNINRIMARLEGKEGLIALKEKQIAVDENTARELDKIQVKIRQIRLVLTLNVKRTERAVQESADQSRQLIRTRTAQLALAVALVTFLAFFASHVFVRRSLIRRLTSLGASMQRIADGHLNAPINIQGDDEIARMAEALIVFRNTAREVEEQQTRAIIESSVAGLIMTDTNGTIEFLSHTARQLFGYENTLTTQTGQSIIDLVLTSDRSTLSGLMKDPKADAIIELLFRCRDGRIFPGDIACRRISQRGGIKLIFTVYDVTDRKEAQDKLEETVELRTLDLRNTNQELLQEINNRKQTELLLRSTKEELVQASKLASLGKMASGISHELNQPLMAVSNWVHNATLLIEKGDLDAANQALQDMDVQIRRLIELASHLRTLARQPDLNFATVDPGMIIERALGLFSERMKQDKLTLINNIPKDSVPIQTDMLRLEQIVINLISNALDSMKQSSQKTLILTIASEEEAILTLSFSDTGSGIAKEDLPHLFDPFFTTKEVGQGMGLGLSISYNIARSLGGTIKAENRQEGGATFTVSLPVKPLDQNRLMQAEEIW